MCSVILIKLNDAANLRCFSLQSTLKYVTKKQAQRITTFVWTFFLHWCCIWSYEWLIRAAFLLRLFFVSLFLLRHSQTTVITAAFQLKVSVELNTFQQWSQLYTSALQISCYVRVVVSGSPLIRIGIFFQIHN